MQDRFAAGFLCGAGTMTLINIMGYWFIFKSRENEARVAKEQIKELMQIWFQVNNIPWTLPQ